MREHGLPPRQGLYDPAYEHDACGIGMLVNIAGRKSHKLVTDAIEILGNLTHRGGVGSEPDTGDGAGILLQIPHDFLARVAKSDGIDLPEAGRYGVAMLFASPDPDRCETTVNALRALTEREGLQVLGCRVVPTCGTGVGATALEVRPAIRQMFIARPQGAGEEEFERALYLIGKLAHK